MIPRRYIGRDRAPIALGRLCLALGLGALALLMGAGCQSARGIVQAQTPGLASGAGATLTGPANSAAPTSQVAERRMTFAAPAALVLSPTLPQPTVPAVHLAPPPVDALPLPPAPQPTAVYERVETTIGQHQDATGLVKAALTASQWGKVRWIGLLCVVLGVGGLLHAAGNEQGYPLVWVKTTVAGAVLLIIGDNPWLLLLLLIPLGFYAVQKLGLLRPIP